MSKARIIADYAGTGASTDLATQTELNTVSTVANAALPTTTAASTYAPLASPAFTGTVAIPNVANLETAVVANTAKVTNYNQTLADINALGVTELGTVTSGVLEDAVTYRGINQDLATTNVPTFGGATINGTVDIRNSSSNIVEKSVFIGGAKNTSGVFTITMPTTGYLSAIIEASIAGYQGAGHFRTHIYMYNGSIAANYTTSSSGGGYMSAASMSATSGVITITFPIGTSFSHGVMYIKVITGNHYFSASNLGFSLT